MLDGSRMRRRLGLLGLDSVTWGRSSCGVIQARVHPPDCWRELCPGSKRTWSGGGPLQLSQLTLSIRMVKINMSETNSELTANKPGWDGAWRAASANITFLKTCCFNLRCKRLFALLSRTVRNGRQLRSRCWVRIGTRTRLEGRISHRSFHWSSS